MVRFKVIILVKLLRFGEISKLFTCCGDGSMSLFGFHPECKFLLLESTKEKVRNQMKLFKLNILIGISLGTLGKILALIFSNLLSQSYGTSKLSKDLLANF